MNNLNNMWPICHDCPYWGICEPPYICGATEQKIKEENLNKFKEVKDDYEIKTIEKDVIINYIKWIIEELNKLNKENYSKEEVKQTLMSIVGEIITH